MKRDVAAEECRALDRERVFETYPGRQSTLGALPIWRALPVRERRLIGPWCFLDRYGPLSFTEAKPMDVAPHPHIGLQTVSWLLDGEVIHRDSLGFEATATRGSVNVMTAGRGIAHSEETPRRNSGRLDGVQLWVALPDAQRDVEPSFQHVASVPRLEFDGAIAQLFAGSIDGTSCDAVSYSDIVGMDIELRRGGRAVLPAFAAREHGLFLLSGDAEFDGEPLAVNAISYVGGGRSELPLRSRDGARLLLLGGVPFAERVLMWWNFVARTPDEIAQARDDWESGGRFGEVRGYDGPSIPAPALSRIARPNPAS